MASSFILKHLPKEVKKKMLKELVVKNTKEYMKLCKKVENPPDDALIMVPYFYAKMMRRYGDLPFDEAFQRAKGNSEDDSREDLEPDDAASQHSLINLRSCHQPIKFTTSYKLKEKQVLVLKDAENELKTNGSVYLNAATGFGKSVGIIHLTNACGYVTLVLATRTGFIDQLLVSFTTHTKAVVWPLSSQHTQKMPAGVQVIITTPGCFGRISVSLLDKVGLLAIDEAPLVCTPQCIGPLLSLRPRYIVCCSATLHRRDGMEKILDMICGPAKVISKLDIPVRVIRWHTGIRVPYYPGRGGKPDWGEHSKFICTHEERNQMIVKFAKKIINASTSPEPREDASSEESIFEDELMNLIKQISKRQIHKIAMITNRVDDHIGLLKPLLLEAGLTCDHVDAKKKTYRDSDVVLGTSSKLGIGFDAALSAKGYNGEPIDVVFQLVSSATEDLIIQQLGRGCRVGDNHPAIFIIIIDNNRISSNHAETVERALEDLDDVKFYDYRGKIAD